MGSACCKRKHDGRHLPTQGETLRTADITQTTILVTASNFESTMNPWQSITKKHRHPFNPKPAVEAVAALAVTREMTESEKKVLLNALRVNPVLAGLPEDVHLTLLESMKAYSLGPYQVVYEEKTEAATFFVVTKGRLEELSAGERVQEILPGDTFGDSALLYDQPRGRTVKTLESCTLWGVDRTIFKQAVAQYKAMTHLEDLTFLRSIKMLESLSDEQVEDLVVELSTHIFPSGSTIVSEGANDSILFIVKEGSVSCSVKGAETRRLSRGDYFGEQALLYDTLRTASVTAVTEVRLLSITRDKLQEKLGGVLQNVMYKNSVRIALSHHEVLGHLTNTQREALIDLVSIHSSEVGRSVNAEGKFVIVLNGSVRWNGETLSRLDVVEGGKVLAIEASEFALLSRQEGEAALGGSFESLASEIKALSFLRNVSLCRSFSSEKLKTLWSVLKEERFERGQVVFEKNAAPEAVYIVKQGQVQVVNDGVVLRTLEKFGMFGERALVEKSARTASVIALEDTECYALYREDFERVADESVLQHIVKRMQLQNDSLQLEDLEGLQLLGKGSYGNVLLVRTKTSKSLYALKAVSRKVVRAHSLALDLQLERQLLLELDHTFIMKLVKTFKDAQRVYFLTEFVQGQELFELLNARKVLLEPESRFYTSCLLLVLEHLHERDIAYRDLKPENVIIDETGYPKLIDFGLAKRIIGRTLTKLGTPHYTAPEIFLGLGYNMAVDYWSLGVMCYEFITGGFPFASDIADPMKIIKAIMHSKLVFPESLKKSSDMCSFIKILLRRDPSYRLTEARKFRTHTWLYGLDWEELISRRIEPPFKPAQTRLNIEQLEVAGTLEALLLAEEEQLSSREQLKEPPDWDREF